MSKENDIINQPAEDFEDVVASHVASKGQIKNLNDLEQIVYSILSTIPSLNRNKLRQEMIDMKIELQNNPTTLDLNKGLAKAQGYKDRLSEIYSLAIRECKLRSRCNDMLINAFIATEAKGKSADARQGEASMRYPMLLIQLEAAESFMKEVEHVLANIKSAHESISRQVSIVQIQLQLGEIRRGAPNIELEAEEIINKNSKGETDWDKF